MRIDQRFHHPLIDRQIAIYFPVPSQPCGDAFCLGLAMRGETVAGRPCLKRLDFQDRHCGSQRRLSHAKHRALRAKISPVMDGPGEPRVAVDGVDECRHGRISNRDKTHHAWIHRKRHISRLSPLKLLDFIERVDQPSDFFRRVPGVKTRRNRRTRFAKRSFFLAPLEIGHYFGDLADLLGLFGIELEQSATMSLCLIVGINHKCVDHLQKCNGGQFAFCVIDDADLLF
jgi:hypothetical protein